MEFMLTIKHNGNYTLYRMNACVYITPALQLNRIEKPMRPNRNHGSDELLLMFATTVLILHNNTPEKSVRVKNDDSCCDVSVCARIGGTCIFA